MPTTLDVTWSCWAYNQFSILEQSFELRPIKNWTQKSYWAYIFLEPSFQPNPLPLTFRFRVCNLSQRGYKYAPQELNHIMKPTSSVFVSSAQVSSFLLFSHTDTYTDMNMFVYFLCF